MKDPVAQIKAWLFPMIITGFAYIIWDDVKEIKGDVKALMAQSNVDKTRIDNLERLIYKSGSTNYPERNNTKNDSTVLAAVMPNNKDLEITQPKKKKS